MNPLTFKWTLSAIRKWVAGHNIVKNTIPASVPYNNSYLKKTVHFSFEAFNK